MAQSEFNGTINGRTAGSYRVRVMGIDYGLDIISSADSEARSRRAFYSITTSGSSFGLILGFISWAERERFNKWMSGFMTSVSEQRAKYGTVTVRVPKRNFVRVGVPEGDLEYGEGLTDMLYLVRLSFVGATNPVTSNLDSNGKGISYFKGPGSSQESSYFYPAGQQIKGAESLEEIIFDSAPLPAGPTAPGAGGAQNPV